MFNSVFRVKLLDLTHVFPSQIYVLLNVFQFHRREQSSSRVTNPCSLFESDFKLY